MQSTPFTHELDEAQAELTEYIVVEPHVEADGVDWCAFWAEYAANLE